MKLIIRLTFLIVIFSSCSKKPFKDIEFENNDYKLYCFAIPNDLILKSTNKFHDEQQDFFITDKEVLTMISSNIIGEKTSRKNTSQSFYIFRLIKDEKIIESGLLDTESGIFIGDWGNYNFDMKKFIEQKDAFNKLSSYKINTKSISSTKKFVEFIDNSNAFIFNDYLKDYESRLEGFNGITELITDTSIINLKVNSIEDIRKQIQNDFKKIDNFKIKEFSTYKTDTISVTILSDRDISNQLPNGYKVVEKYTNSIDNPLLVYDLDKDEIVNFFKENGISNYEIDDLNKKTIGNKQDYERSVRPSE